MRLTAIVTQRDYWIGVGMVSALSPLPQDDQARGLSLTVVVTLFSSPCFLWNTPLQLGTMRSLYSTSSNLGRSGSQLDLTAAGLGPSTAGGLGAAAGAGLGHAGAAGAAAAHAGTGAGGLVEELTPEELPVDWSLKRSVVVASASRFACHDLAQAAAPRTREWGVGPRTGTNSRQCMLLRNGYGALPVCCCRELHGHVGAGCGPHQAHGA